MDWLKINPENLSTKGLAQYHDSHEQGEHWAAFAFNEDVCSFLCAMMKRGYDRIIVEDEQTQYTVYWGLRSDRTTVPMANKEVE